MSDETKHVTPSAPRTLSDKPESLIDLLKKGGDGHFKVTRGTPILKCPPQGAEWESLVNKLNEIIDAINKLNEL